MSLKLKKKRKNKSIIFVILILILGSISISYSLWETKIKIQGQVTGIYINPKLELNLLEQKIDNNITKRYTQIDNLYENNKPIYRVTSEELEENVLTTKLKKINEQNKPIKLKISFKFDNTIQEYINGTIILKEKKDLNNNLKNISCQIDNNNIVITGEIQENTFDTNIFYNFEITYEKDEIKYYFYYKVIFENEQI